MAPHCTAWKAPREAPGFPALDHERIHQHVGEGQPQPHHGEQSHEPPVAMRRDEPHRQAGSAGQCGGQEQVALAAPAEERHAVGQEPVGRLDQPGDDAEAEERRDLAGGQPALLENDGQDLVGQGPHALGEVDDGEQEGETLGVRARERMQAAQPVQHPRMIRRL